MKCNFNLFLNPWKVFVADGGTAFVLVLLSSLYSISFVLILHGKVNISTLVISLQRHTITRRPPIDFYEDSRPQ